MKGKIMTKKRQDPKWRELSEALWTRCNGFCEVTGVPLDYDTFDRHHRRPKAMGGTYRADTDTLVNLIAVDPIVHNGHAASIHQAPSWSRPRGYLLRQTDDPAEYPILRHGRTWVVLTVDGQAVELSTSHQRYWTARLRAEEAVAANLPTRRGLSQYR
jgi:hypothetical protein